MTSSKYSNFSARPKGSLKGGSINFTLVPVDNKPAEKQNSSQFKPGDSLIFSSKSKIIN
jgi:hypothetical protein